MQKFKKKKKKKKKKTKKTTLHTNPIVRGHRTQGLTYLLDGRGKHV